MGKRDIPPTQTYEVYDFQPRLGHGGATLSKQERGNAFWGKLPAMDRFRWSRGIGRKSLVLDLVSYLHSGNEELLQK